MYPFCRFKNMNEKFWKIAHPMTEEQKQKISERSAAPAADTGPSQSEIERSAPPADPSLPKEGTPGVPPPPSPETGSVLEPSLSSTTASSPSMCGSGFGVRLSHLRELQSIHLAIQMLLDGTICR
jgi:hypothetical protein